MNITTLQKIEVMQAFADGMKIECCEKGFVGVWVPVTTSDPVWDWFRADYRIAPMSTIADLERRLDKLEQAL